MRDGHKWRDRGTRNRSQARHYGARQKKCPTSSCEAVQRRSSTIFSRLRGSSQRRACWDQAMIFSCKVPPGQPAPPWRPLPKQRLHRVWRPPHTLVLSSRACRCTWRAYRRWMLPSAATPVIRVTFGVLAAASPGFVMPAPRLVRRRRSGYACSRRTVPNAFPHGPHSMEWGMHGRCGDPGAVCKDTARSARDRARQLRGAPPRPRVSGASSAPVASIPCSPMRKRRRQA